MTTISTTLAHEIADEIVNEDGYADDPIEHDRRSEERDRIEGIVQRVLKRELAERIGV